jgi:hypothetical protein
MIIKGLVEKSVKIGDAVFYYKEPSSFKITQEVYEVAGVSGEEAFKKLNNSKTNIAFCMHFLKKVITRWEGVKDENGNEIAYQPEYLEFLEDKELMELLNFLKNLIGSSIKLKKEGENEIKNL